ncbi:hypothetical protein BVRB_4g080200 [Beta vulgaris subsp. vulgaris]|nr:hypothetical protein BVRB_4g080200 [Beta vulgaris subsp. vulgaris]
MGIWLWFAAKESNALNKLYATWGKEKPGNIRLEAILVMCG